MLGNVRTVWHSRVFLPVLGTWPSPQNWEFFMSFYTKLGKTRMVKYNNEKQKIKYLVHKWAHFNIWNEENNLLWHSAVKMSHKMVIFLFLVLGIFSLKLGKTYFLPLGTWPDFVIKMGPKKNCTLMIFLNVFFLKINLKKSSRWQKTCKNYTACKELTFKSLIMFRSCLYRQQILWYFSKHKILIKHYSLCSCGISLLLRRVWSTVNPV